MTKSKEKTPKESPEDPVVEPEEAADQDDLEAEKDHVEPDSTGAEVIEPEEQEEEPRDPLTQALEESEEYKDRWLRLAAEFENYKKRVARDYKSLVSSAAEGLIRELLPTLDAVGRANDHSKDGEPDSAAFQEGMRMIMEQFPKVLQGRGLEEIAAAGAPFDPHVHEALMQMPSEEHEAGLVAEVVERGYTLGGKVIKPSKVVVSLGPLPQKEEKEEKDGKKGRKAKGSKS